MDHGSSFGLFWNSGGFQIDVNLIALSINHIKANRILANQRATS